MASFAQKASVTSSAAAAMRAWRASPAPPFCQRRVRGAPESGSSAVPMLTPVVAASSSLRAPATSPPSISRSASAPRDDRSLASATTL